MTRRTWLFCAVIALCPVLATLAWLGNRARADKAPPAVERPASKKMPLTQVVLFNTGLGYFQREGEVEGDARIDLTIPASDINDILKTLIIDNAGKPSSVSYDGAEPVDSKLKSFGVDLTTNPTLGQLLNQARGEKVELTLEGAGGGAATPLTGTIVGMEAYFENQTREIHHLNLLCTDGVRRVALERIQRVRFLDPTLEDEFRRALAVLSTGRSEQRRQVSVSLKGEGKRKVKIGHVAETPIWKASYRLVLDNKEKKPTLQAWAIVENTTEEDWKDVRVVLVNGRPITFQMDLAQQLFMPRPKVEPEVYASLRPPTFAPATQFNDKGQPVDDQGRVVPPNQVNLGNLRQQTGLQLGQLGQGINPGFARGAVNLGFGGGMAGMGGGFTGWGDLGSPVGQSLFGPGGTFNRYQPIISSVPPRLTYEDLQNRRNVALAQRKQAAAEAKRIGTTLADLGDGIDEVVTNADRIGEGFRYSLEPRVNLSRQKSGMVSMLNGEVALHRLSIYTPSVHPRFPLQAVKLKNSTGQHLQQGPVAVYDGGDYVGDCRLPDMQPDQERLLTFAVDLGIEVRPEQKKWTEDVTAVEIHEGVLTVTSREHQKTTYQVLNRSKSDRTVQVEHAVTDWKLAEESAKPAETTRQQYRFEWKVEAGKTERKTIQEVKTQSVSRQLAAHWDDSLKVLANSAKVSPAVKAALNKVLTGSRRISSLAAEASKVDEQMREAKAEQDRVTTTLAKLPAGSAGHKRYLSKFEELDIQIDKLKVELKEKKDAEAKERREHDAMVKGLTAK